jgi:RNA polymerase sigma-70 factor (ECF subfamily)
MVGELVCWEKIVQHDAAAFELLFNAYHAQLERFAQVYLGVRNSAEDVVQESFLELWKRPKGFDPDRGSLKQYLFGITRKRAAQINRRERSRPYEHDRVLAPRSENQVFTLNNALEHLDVDAKSLIWLREVEGYSYAELAQILDKPIGTIKSQLFSAREDLRQIWFGRQEPIVT